jgi:hypothetical protein
MLNYILSFFYHVEKPTINPNSMAPLPTDKFYNELIFTEKYLKKIKSQKQKQQLDTYYDFYNH